MLTHILLDERDLSFALGVDERLGLVGFLLISLVSTL
jgi:hypothetical protein